MKICLIDPGGVTKGLNVGLGYLSSSLIEGGHKIKVVDLNNDPNSATDRINSVREYDIIGISIKSFTIQSAIEISKVIGRRDLICGGPHITLDGYNFLRDNHNFSIGVIGDGEQTLVELVNALGNNLDLQDVRGILYRDKSEIMVNPRREFIANLVSLPRPNYEVFDSFNGTITGYPLITSRGCPYSCIYCSVGKVSGKRWRYRTPKDVIEELKFSKSRYNSKSFEILDDNFTQNIGRAKRICRLLIEHNIGMSYCCSNGIRADRFDEELAALMKSSGCESVSLGIESLDETVFDNLKKGESLKDVKQTLRALNSHKIGVTGFFMIGLPGDNLQKTNSSIEQGKKLGLHSAIWNLFTPYPGTEAWQWVNQNARMLRDWKQGFHFGTELNPVFETRDFSAKDRISAYKLANIKFSGYLAFFDRGKSFLVNAFSILKLILKYDAKNLPFHLVWAFKNINRIYGRVKR